MKYTLISLLVLVAWACSPTDKAADKDSILKTWVVKAAEVDSNYMLEEEGKDRLEIVKENSLGATLEFKNDSTVIIHNVGLQSSIIDTSVYMVSGDQLSIINKTRFYEETATITKKTSDSLVLWFNKGEKEEWFTIRLVPKG